MNLIVFMRVWKMDIHWVAMGTRLINLANIWSTLNKCPIGFHTTQVAAAWMETLFLPAICYSTKIGCHESLTSAAVARYHLLCVLLSHICEQESFFLPLNSNLFGPLCSSHELLARNLFFLLQQ